MQARVDIKHVGKRMMGLHNELGSSTIEGHKVRFCQCITGAWFWLSIDDELYSVSTEDLMNSVLNTVMQERKAEKQMGDGSKGRNRVRRPVRKPE